MASARRAAGHLLARALSSGGRTALRSALYLLRRHLHEARSALEATTRSASIRSRLATDVAEMLDDIAAQEFDRALSRYRGDCSRGFHQRRRGVRAAGWTGSATRLRALAVQGRAGARRRHVSATAISRARRTRRSRAAELDPDDEPTTRRWITLLDRAGDRTKAHAVFEQFRSRAAAEFGTEPSPQTLALMHDLRARSTPLSADRPALESAPPAVARERAGGPPRRRRSRPTGVQSRAATTRSPGWLVAAVIATIAAVSLLVATRRFPLSDRIVTRAADAASATPVASRRLVLLPIVDETGDSSLKYLATGIAYGVTRRLERVGTLAIRSGAPAEWSASAHRGSKSGGALRAAVLLRLTLAREADSLRMRATLLDSASGDEQEILLRRFTTGDLGNLESHLAAAVTGALFRAGVPFAPTSRAASADPESFRLAILGYHQMITMRDRAAALRSFTRATELDPSNARAWSGVSSIWGQGTVTSRTSLEEGFELTAAAASRALAIDSAQGSALANLGAVSIMKYGTLSAGMPLIRRAMVVEPSNPEVFNIASYLLRYGHQWDEARDLIRIARQLDPLTAHFIDSEAGLELCAGRPAASIVVYRQLLAMDPGHAAGRVGLVRALAQHGQYDDALDSWRRNRPPTTHPAVLAALATARGRSGYFAVRRLEGRLLLADSAHRPEHEAGSALLALQLQFQSGDTAAGFATLIAAMKRREPWIYRLSCMAPLDEARELPRFNALLAQIGAMPAN